MEMIDRKTVLAVTLACFVAGLGAATLQAGEPVRFDEATMSEPKVVHKVAPQYPADAKKEGVQGTVVLEALIGEDGSVRETHALKGEDGRLVEAARAAVGQWRFEPVRDQDGEPVAVRFKVTIRFKLS
jgi:TonB family protein